MKKKIYAAALVTAVCASLLLAVLFTSVQYNDSVSREQERVSSFMDVLEGETEEEKPALAERFSRTIGGRVLFLTAQGVSVADSGGEVGQDYSARSEVSVAMQTGEGSAVGAFYGKNSVSLCRAASDGGLILLVLPAPSLSAAIVGLLPAEIGVLFILLAVCFLVVRVTEFCVFKPIEDLTHEAAVSSGKEVKTECTELIPLAKLMNEMNADLDAKVAKMKEDRGIEKLILNSMEHGIVIFRSATDVILINRTAAKLLDYEKNEPIRCFSEDREISVILEERQSASAPRSIGGRDYSFRFTFKKEANVLLITDITETMAAARSKNDFIANVTHEMNTPLTSIRGFAELIEADALPAERIPHAARTIIQQSDRLSKLIRRIINYSALDSDSLPDYEVDVSALLREVLPGFEPRFIEKNIRLAVQAEEGVKVLSRRERLVEIVNNLISNGIRYNKEGGTLTVTLTGGKTPVLRVEDTGVGLSDEDKNRIFDRFYTVDKSHGGTGGGFGLGLAIVKKLCMRAGWKLSVESELEKGTAFSIEFLPLEASSQRSASSR